MKNHSLIFILFLANVNLSLMHVFSQPLHIVPPTIITLDSEIELLKLLSTNEKIYSYVIQDNSFYLNLPDGQTEVFPLGNKTVLDLCNAVNKNRSEVVLSTDYPHIEATRLGITKKSVTFNKSTAALVKPSNVTTKIDIDFGLLFSLADSDSDLNTNSLLNQTGFNLDLIGQRKFDWLGGSYTSLRVGFASNLNLIVNTDSLISTGGQIESAIKLANQVTISAHGESIISYFKEKDFQIGIYIEAALIYAKLKPVDLSNSRFVLNKKSYNISDTFSVKAIENYKNMSDNVLPIGNFELGFNFRYIKDDKLLFYGGIGVLGRPNLQRGFRFYRFEDNQIDKDRLDYLIFDHFYYLSMRPKIGLRIANIIDLRVEAILAFNGPKIDRYNPNNLFRILVARDFPLKN